MSRSKAKLTVKDHGFEKLGDAVKSLAKRPTVKVGVLAGKNERTGDSIGNVELAFAMEFGTETAPARPFLRMTHEAKRLEWGELGVKLLQKVAEGKMHTDQALGVLGEKAAADVRRTITKGSGVPPPNAPSTIAAKGSSRPLVDKGILVASITWDLAK